MGLFDFFKSKKLQVIGQHIIWENIVGKVFRIMQFERAGSVIDANGNIQVKRKLRPYGYLHVVSPDYKEPVLLPIIHKDDFLLASSFFDDENLLELFLLKDVELLVTYVPKEKLPNAFAGGYHALHYVITPPDTIDYYYKIQALRKVKASPEKLFIKFIWEGETRIQVNKEPDL